MCTVQILKAEVIWCDKSITKYTMLFF